MISTLALAGFGLDAFFFGLSITLRQRGGCSSHPRDQARKADNRRDNPFGDENGCRRDSARGVAYIVGCGTRIINNFCDSHGRGINARAYHIDEFIDFGHCCVNLGHDGVAGEFVDFIYGEENGNEQGYGEFRFEQGQKPSSDAPVMPTPIPVENLIMEGVRRIDEWGRIKDRIPSTDMIVRFIDQPGEKAKGVKLAPEEWRVFARINGKDTLTDIAQKTSLSEFDVCRIVYGFVTAGLVEVIKKPKPAPLTSSARGAQPMEPPRLKKSLVNRIINRIRGM